MDRKIKYQAQKWHDQAKKELQKGHQPDAGHSYYLKYGDGVISLPLLPPYPVIDGPPGYYLISVATECGLLTVFISKEMYAEFKDKKYLFVTCKSSPSQRYNAQNGDWVLPFSVVSLPKQKEDIKILSF